MRGPGGEPDVAGARAAWIYGRLRHHGDLAGRYRWQGWAFADASFLAGLILCIPLLLIELALLPRHPVRPPVAMPSDRGAALLLGLLPLEGWVLHRLLQATRRRNEPPRAWALACRFAVSSVPLLGLYALPWWHLIESRRSAWAFRRTAPAVLELARGRPAEPYPRTSWSRRPPGLPSLITAILLGVVLPLVWAVWLGGTISRGPERRAMALGACAFLHLTLSACLLHYRRALPVASHGWGRRSPVVLAALGLLPYAGPIAIFAGFLLVDGRRDGTLVADVYNRRWNAGRLPSWRLLEEALGRRWRQMPWWRRWRRPRGLERAPRTGRAEKGLLAFYRYKSLLTLFDGVALAWLLAALAGRAPGLASAIALALRSAWWTSIALAGLGLAIQGIALTARLLRATDLVDRLDRRPYGRALLSSYAALWAGILLGELLAEGRGRELALLLSLVLALGATAGAFALMLQTILPAGRVTRVEPRDVLAPALVLLALLLAEAVLALTGGAGRVVAGLAVAAALCPVWSLASGLALGGWLLRPCRFRDLWDRRIPPDVRAVLGLLTLTALLPLGGLAIPLWILARQKLQPLRSDDSFGMEVVVERQAVVA